MNTTADLLELNTDVNHKIKINVHPKNININSISTVFQIEKYLIGSAKFVFDYKQNISLQPLDPKNTILFFDIDNTLIRMKTDICSDEWVKWQIKLIGNHPHGHPHSVADNLSDFFNLYRRWMLHYQCDVDTVENLMPELINQFYEYGFKIIFITARHKDIANVTYKQLSKYYDLKKLYNDISIINYFECMMENGIFFAAGRNKALCIEEIIKKIHIDNIFFLDDSISECQNLKNVFDKQNDKNIIICHYTYPEKFYQEFDLLDKSKLHKQWKKSIKNIC